MIDTNIDTNIDTTIDPRFPSESHLIIDPLARKLAIKVLATVKPLARHKVTRGGVPQHLSHLTLVTLKDGWLDLTASDGDRYARMTIARSDDTRSSWAIMAPSSDIAAWLKGAKAREVSSVVISNVKLIVTSGGVTRDIGLPEHSTNVFDGLEGLAYDRGDSGVELEVPWDIVPNIAAAAGDDSTLPALTGVHVEWLTSVNGSSSLEALAATDRYRLHTYEAPDTLPGTFGSANVPAKWLLAASKLPSGWLYITERWAVTEANLSTASGGFGFRLTTRLLDAEFPKWRALLPLESSGPMTFDAADMREAVKPFAKACSTRTNDPVLIDLDAKALSVGDGSLIVAAPFIVAGLDMPRVSGWNPRYLLTALEGLEGEVSMACPAANKPAILTSSSSPVKRLVMPVRTI